MDSVENIRKNRKKLFLYSIILLIVGIFIGYSVTYLLKPSKQSKCVVAPISSSNNNINDNMQDVAKNLLNDYITYYNEILINDEQITYDDKEAYLVSSAFSEIKDLFTSDITLDKIYNYYDYSNNSYNDIDSNKPVYTQVSDNYYFDGVCNASGNKLMYDDFEILNRTSDTIELSYKVIVMSIVDDSIMESSYDDKMIIKLEDGSWKINKASIIGRCGLPYKIG